ncbi:MAG: CPBP family intramembrane metalloprotease [Anaerolineales bacterium]|nr:CPBP family intramembrane metalloprotease [Anaerolineales bacterium]
MQSNAAPTETGRGKNILAINMALTVFLTLVFWAIVRFSRVEGLPLYFLQLGLYAVFFLQAWWGLKHERIVPPFNLRRIGEALACSLAGWLFFVVVIQVTGMIRLPEEFAALRNTPAVQIGAKIISTWFFVGLGEEVLFRGYFQNAFRRHATRGTDRQRTAAAVLAVSAFFSLWHLPVRIIWLLAGELDPATLLLSLVIVFLPGLGYAFLYIRSENILLNGLVHGLSDYPLIGMSSQFAPAILLAAIACVELARFRSAKKPDAERSPS